MSLFVASTSLPLMFLPSLGVGELAIIFVIVLLLFGPGKLPQAAKAMGDGMRQFKNALNPNHPDPPAKPPDSDEPADKH